MPLYSYVCKLGHTAELLRPMSVNVEVCRVCGNPSPRQSANLISFKGPDVDTRGMFSRMMEASAEIDHAASEVEADTGSPVQMPSLWQEAKRRAAAIDAAGEASDFRVKS